MRRWKKDSVFWEYRFKRKVAVFWISFVREGLVGFVIVVDVDESMFMGKIFKNLGYEVDRVFLIYIIVSNGLEVGKMVMNCDLFKRFIRS